MENKKNNLLTAGKGSKLLSRDAITIYIVILFYGVYSALIYTDSAGRQMLNMVISLSCYLLLSVSLNLVVGFLGELSLGHAAFMSVGAYSGAILSVTLLEKFPGMPMYIRLPIAMIFGGLLAAVFGIIIGIPALRLNGDYLAIVTLAFGEIIKNIITNLEFTGGAIGYNTEAIYESPKVLLPYTIVAVIVSVILIINLVNSRHGRAITAVRDNKIAASSMGVNTVYYKLMVFAFAAFIAGVAGVIWGHSFPIIKAAKFDFNMSIEILVIVVLGGMGSVRGSVVAAIILRVLPEMLKEFEQYRMLIYSLLLIIIMLFNSSPAFAGIRAKLDVKNVFATLKNKFSKSKEAGSKMKGGENDVN